MLGILPVGLLLLAGNYHITNHQGSGGGLVAN